MKPRIADLYCGAGGAAKGLSLAGFEVVGFDIALQKNYPFEFHQQDALTVDLSGFDAVWASPPCQRWCDTNSIHKIDYPDFIAPTRAKLLTWDHPYILENVDRAPLLDPVRLCGTMFSLLVIRHRLFESSESLFIDKQCNHWGSVAGGDYAAVYGHGGKGRRHGRDPITGERLRDKTVLTEGPPWDIAMGINWMTKQELTQAIPPAYSEFLGKQLIKAIEP